MLDPNDYACPVCARKGGDWEFRYLVGDTTPAVYDCECGARHWIHQGDGGLETITAKQRRSSQRDYASQLASVRDEFSEDGSADR